MVNIKQALKALGFSEKEVEIYLTLLELQTASYTQLAKASGLKRTTLYHLIEGLQERGVVRYLVDQRRLAAAAPEELFQYLQGSILKFHKFIPQLKELGKEQRPISRVQFYSGTESIKQLYLALPSELPPKKDRTIRVVSDCDTWDAFWRKHDQAFIKKYLAEKKAKGFNWKALVSGNIEKSHTLQLGKQHGFTTKAIPSEYRVEFDMEIHSTHIIITDLKNKQPYAIKMISSELAQALTNFFEFTWHLHK